MMLKNIAQPGRPQMTTWRLHIACWIPKDTNTHPEYAIFIDFLLQQWLNERPQCYVIVHSLSFYLYIYFYVIYLSRVVCNTCGWTTSRQMLHASGGGGSSGMAARLLAQQHRCAVKGECLCLV